MSLVPIRRRLNAIAKLAHNTNNSSLTFVDAENARAFFVIYNIMNKMNKNELSDTDIAEQISKSQLPIVLLQKIAQKFLSFDILSHIFNYWEIKVLKQQLPLSPEGTISGAFFAPTQNLFEVLISLIKAEKSRIYVASYTLNNQKIIQELIQAIQRGVRVDIIVDAVANKDSALLRNRQLPICTWQSSADSTPFPPKMHNKFFIFTKNIFEQSILVTGSANYTEAAQINNWENIIVINNNAVIKQFHERFNHLLESSHCSKPQLLPRSLSCSKKDFSDYAPLATRLRNIISKIFNERTSFKRSTRSENEEPALQIKHSRFS